MLRARFLFLFVLVINDYRNNSDYVGRFTCATLKSAEHTRCMHAGERREEINPLTDYPCSISFSSPPPPIFLYLSFSIFFLSTIREKISVPLLVRVRARAGEHTGASRRASDTRLRTQCAGDESRDGTAMSISGGRRNAQRTLQLFVCYVSDG